MATPAEALARLLEALDKLEIPYEVGADMAEIPLNVPSRAPKTPLFASWNGTAPEVNRPSGNGAIYAESSG
jgi:hypothetical protein